MSLNSARVKFIDRSRVHDRIRMRTRLNRLDAFVLPSRLPRSEQVFASELEVSA